MEDRDPMDHFAAIVKVGAEWLDEVKPCWHTLVDRSSLNMADASRCILGQVFDGESGPREDGFWYARRVFGLLRETVAERGFDIHPDTESDAEEFAMMELQRAWDGYLDSVQAAP